MANDAAPIQLIHRSKSAGS